MQIPRPPAAGDAGVVKHLRSVLFSEPILGAARVRPKGYAIALLAYLLAFAGAIIARRATEPLPPTILYLAVTPVDIRLFSKPIFAGAFEIGRWKKGSYRASVREGSFSLKLELELERLGQVTLIAGHKQRAVLDLVTLGASGPAP